jgi:glycine/D-amino acid oxidase-like deaminating enzyme
MASFDVIVIGAGIVGCACALECAQAGLHVGVVQRNVPGGGATAAGMGHVVVMDDSPAQLALTRYSRSLWLNLLAELPRSVEYQSRGTIWVAADDEEMQEVRNKHATYLAAGIASTILNDRELASAEPNLRQGLAGGLLVPDDGVIYPPAAAAWFLEEAVRRGTTLFRGHSVVEVTNGEVRLSNGHLHRAAHVLIASGVDIDLLPWLPIQKRKGHLLITDRYPGMVHHQLVELGYLKSAHSLLEDSVAFNIQPRLTGQLLIGSSRQYGDEDRAVNPALLRRMLDRAMEYMPALRRVSGIRVWTGFRAATPDKLPLIGPTQDPWIHLAVGFEGLGITNAPGAARIAVDHLLGRTPAIDAAPYLPSRFELASLTPLHEVTRA